jgi:hypothetical protein
MVGKPSMSEHLSFEEASRDPAFAQILDWIQTFLCAPHPDLGRDGDVCPFARSALTRNSIEFFRNHSEDLESFERDVEQHMEEFESTAHSNIYSCRIIMPVKIDQPDRAVLAVQKKWKPQFVERHMMLGQFFKDCEEPGLWSQSFRPLQTPVPLLAIRNMVPTDIAFLYHEESYVQTYLEKFGNRGKIALRQFQTNLEASR